MYEVMPVARKCVGSMSNIGKNISVVGALVYRVGCAENTTGCSPVIMKYGLRRFRNPVLSFGTFALHRRCHHFILLVDAFGIGNV